MRKPYLDNIRWTVVLLVLVYHVCYLFNGAGVPGGIPEAANIPAFDALAYMVYPWFMALLFVVAGVSARYSLQKRTGKQFIKERADKLLVPSTLGLFVIHWITGYFNMYRFGIYFASFLIGYYVFFHDEVQKILEKACLPLLCLAVAGAVCYTFYYFGSNYTSPECLQSVVTNLYLWIVILAVFGCFRRYFNRETSFTRYMTGSSFGIYILHYPILLGTGCVLHTYFHLPAVWNYGIALMAEMVMTFAVYEGIKRIPVVRYLVLGIRSRKGR